MPHPESPDSSRSYGPDRDDQVTHLFRMEAEQEQLVDGFINSLTGPDAALDLISFRHQREFLTRRRMRRYDR